MKKKIAVNLAVSIITLTALVAVVYRPDRPAELPNRIPEAPPYVTEEAQVFPPPFEEFWTTSASPGQCRTCHTRIFDEWNGSMMSNSWRDPVWRAAFFLIARLTSTDGDCDIPEPPDGTERARINPFAQEDCTSRFDMGDGFHTTARSGSLLDGFCPRCHMPTNYIDNIPLQNVSIDDESGREHGALNPNFDPTSDAGTGIAYATLEGQLRNTESGKQGLTCGFCHTMVESRETPYHNYEKVGTEYTVAVGDEPRQELLSAEAVEMPEEPSPERSNLGYAVGAGAYRVSPHAIGMGEVFGPLAATAEREGEIDKYLSEVFGREVPVEVGDFSKHQGFQSAKYHYAEMCSACHDVTNPLTLRNTLGLWVGGFPIERTYTEWAESRYADRPGNESYDPEYKRDCQTCHMQQEYGQAGTAQTLYENGEPVPPLASAVSDTAPERETFFSHHFVGGNAYVPRLIGRDVGDSGRVESYPELSVFSYSSADPKSPYYNAYWTGVEERGEMTQHARMAWDRLRHALSLELTGPEEAAAGTQVPLQLRVENTGCGHNFPSGFPEGRIGWVALRAYDLASGNELEIHDSHWQRSSLGVGYLTTEDMKDPTYPASCNWKLPAGSPDPYSYQFKAVATLGDGCPTLDLLYAAPLNLVTNDQGLPIDAAGTVIGRKNPDGLPQYRDLDGDGDLYDDAYLLDTRLRAQPHPGAKLDLDRYAVVVPPETQGPVAVTAAVYYQSLEAIVAKKFLGNLADTDTDHHLEPCVLNGSCDGRQPTVEPAVVEGAPPVPMEVTSWIIRVADRPASQASPGVALYPSNGSENVYQDVVVKATFSAPVRPLTADDFLLFDASGARVLADVDQIGDGTWALFPSRIFLDPGATYTARLAPGVCDLLGNCRSEELSWSFRIADREQDAEGDTSVRLGFEIRESVAADYPPRMIAASRTPEGEVTVTFSEPVMNVTRLTLRVFPSRPDVGCVPAGEAVDGEVASGAGGRTWQFRPAMPLATDRQYCVEAAAAIYDLSGTLMERAARPVAAPDGATGRRAAKGSATRSAAPAAGG